MASGAGRARAWAVINVYAVTARNICVALRHQGIRWTGVSLFLVGPRTTLDVLRWANLFGVGFQPPGACSFLALGSPHLLSVKPAPFGPSWVTN